MINLDRLAYDAKHAVRGLRRDWGFTAVAMALGLALPATWALGRLVASQLFGVRPMDGITIAVASALIASVALLASALPARRASAVSPTEALRAE